MTISKLLPLSSKVKEAKSGGKDGTKVSRGFLLETKFRGIKWRLKNYCEFEKVKRDSELIKTKAATFAGSELINHGLRSTRRMYIYINIQPRSVCITHDGFLARYVSASKRILIFINSKERACEASGSVSTKQKLLPRYVIKKTDLEEATRK